MPIILEGPDCAGKSTLAEKIAHDCGMNIIKMTANGGQSKYEYRQKLNCIGCVIDRCWISEQIYAKYFGRNQRISDLDCAILNDDCWNRRIPIIFVMPPLETVVGRLVLRGDEFDEVVGPNIKAIYNDYLAYAEDNKSIVRVVHDNDPISIYEEVMKCTL